MSKSSQQIILLALNKAGLQCLSTVVYTENWESARKSLWMDLCYIVDTYRDMPWAEMGDFNVRFLDEKVGGSPLTIHKLKDFNGCISYCSLSDILYTGSIWSLSNRTSGQRKEELWGDWIGSYAILSGLTNCLNLFTHIYVHHLVIMHLCYCKLSLLQILVQRHLDFIITGWNVKDSQIFYRDLGSFSILGILSIN